MLASTVPKRRMELGSGTLPTVGAPTTPVLPLVPEMSAAKNKLSLFFVKLAVDKPVAEMSNVIGLRSVGGLSPPPQVGQLIAYCQVPLPSAMIEPADVEVRATGWLFVAAEVKSVSVGVPARSNSKVFPLPAPVFAKSSPAFSV